MMIRSLIKIIILAGLCLFLIACSDDSSSSIEAKKDHVWKEQTDVINKAKEAEKMIMDSAENTRKTIEMQE